MKKITQILKIALFLLVTGSIKLNAQQCVANFTYNVGPNGNVTFTSTSVPQGSVTAYYWSFGNSTTFTTMGSPFASATYTANGTYTVNLFILSTVPSCSASSTQTIIVNTVGCGLIANFNFTQGSNGLVNFNNISSGTVTGVTYNWNFGDGSPISNVVSPSHTYANNGTYPVMLYANNNFTNNACFDSLIFNVVVNSICNLVPSYTYTQGLNGQVNFQSTSTGTIPTSQYFWSYGDGGTGTGMAPSHTYANGTYVATLTVANNSLNCFGSTTQTIAVTSNTCFVNANFTHTVGAGGVVSFNSTSTGTNANTTYTWNFGNGFGSNQLNPTQTYINGGVHNITLIAMNNVGCTSTISQTVNISTVPCTANANFTLVPAGPPQVWNAIPSYPYNVSVASWSWGDGQTSNTMYATHAYSVTGNYNICLTVTASCGATATACSSYSIYRSASNIIYVNVLPPPVQMNVGTTTGLDDQTLPLVYEVFPNPADDKISLRISGLENGQVKITMNNLLGAQVYSGVQKSEGAEMLHEINAENLSAGIYLISINNGASTFTQKVVISR